ncbi:MAG: WecB/TagA/CpsF family glycosyltransferase [Paraglaciecola sp.]|nr:WecB/TagA/CpsF family glycosyltransferase [Paraglaciecola sp.]
MRTKPLSPNIRSRVVDHAQKKHYLGSEFNGVISLFLLLISLPICLVNICLAFAKGKPIFEYSIKYDCLARNVQILTFSSGLLKGLPMLWEVLNKRISLCGMPVGVKLSKQQRAVIQPYAYICAGLCDAVTLHQASGLTCVDKTVLLEQQFAASRLAYVALLVKYGLSKLLYATHKSRLTTPTTFTLFGLRINNDSMAGAIEWILSERSKQDPRKGCKTGCFINVNSVNLMASHSQLGAYINQTDRSFADGSGLRLAAKTLGINIKDNINGTDMLPYLCAAAEAQGISIYLLGSKPGVAVATAKNLGKLHPILRIAGAEHGYFEPTENSKVVERINHSNAGILLVAMGSPLQEKWLQDNALLLKCRTALAVGGLFDFYSGKISRAPMWMRELGLEWVWRLMQQPKAKFFRYVVGNPLFLIRTYIFNHASRGL